MLGYLYHKFVTQEYALSFVLFLVILIPSRAFASSDSLYIKVNEHPLIRMADSIYLYKDDYNGARDYFLKAINDLNEDEVELRVYCYIKISNTFTSEHNYPEAEKYIKKAQKILSQLKLSNTMLQAEYDLYYGRILTKTGELDSAAYYIDRSIDIKKKYHKDEIISLTESLFFRAEIYTSLNYPAKTEELYRKILSLYKNKINDDHILYGRLYSSLASCLRIQFDFKNAIDYAEMALNIYRMDSANNPNRLVVGSIIYANIFLTYNDYDAAIPIYLNLLNQLKHSDRYKGWMRDYYVNLITAYLKTEQLNNARNYLEEDHSFLANNGLMSNFNKAIYLLQSGQYNLACNNVDKSRNYILEALDIYKKNIPDQTDDYSYGYTLLGDMYMKTGQIDSALINYQKSLIIYLDNFDNDDIYSNPRSQDDPDKRKIFNVLYRKARAFRVYYEQKGKITYLREALNIYNLIDKLNDQARSSMLKETSLMILNDYYHSGYEMAIDCAYELFRQTQDTSYLNNAFTLMEKNKSMLLFKSLTLAERSKSIDLSYSIKNHEDSLRLLYSDYERKIRNEMAKTHPDENTLHHLESEKSKITREMDNLKIQISKEFPNYYKIKYDSLVKDLYDFQMYCQNNDLFGIEYFWGDSAIFQVWTDGTSANIVKIKNTKQIRANLRDLLAKLSYGVDFSNADDDYKGYVHDAYYIYQALFENKITDSNNAHILIIPDGMLSQLPFGALLTSDKDTTYTDYSSLPYLIRNSNIDYSYSVNLLLNPKSGKNKSPNDLLAFSYSGLDALTNNTNRSDENNELPYSAFELRAIKQVMPGNNRFYYDTTATELNFKTSAHDFRILHLAVHGYADTENENNSRLEFKAGDDTIEDHNLYISELYGMDLSNTQLAVLSACETGVGKEFRGEGVFSMARGFFYAGCPSVVMSLWRISDEYSAMIMENFYRYLIKGKNSSEALRLAKLDYIKKQDEYKAHPADWAAFVMLGKDFSYKKPFLRPVKIFVLIFMALVFIFLFRKIILARSDQAS